MVFPAGAANFNEALCVGVKFATTLKNFKAVTNEGNEEG